MKTLIVYELVPEETKFFVVEGERTELNGCFVNSTDEKKFSKEVRDEVGEAKWGDPVKMPLVLDSPEALTVVHCGFIL